MTKSFQDLIDESIFISTEYQARLAELSGNSEWSVDFSAPSFTLQSDSSVSLTPYLLGTESKNRGSWIWSWQELGHFPDSVVSAAIQAREAGAQAGVPELTSDELILSEGLARRLTLASKAMTGIYAHYPVAAGAGVRAWILVEGEALELEAPTVNRMGRVMAESLKNNIIVNQQRAVESYARLRGAHISWDTDATAVITATDGALRLWFDQGKISGIEAAQPEVDSQELNRCAQRALAVREKFASERSEVERIAADEAAYQDTLRQQADRDADLQQAAPEPVSAEEQSQASTVAEQQLPDFVEDSPAPLDQQVPAKPDLQESGEVAGVVSTERVYPDSDQPFNQDPQEDAEFGRVTTSAIDPDHIADGPAQPQKQQQDPEPAAFRVAGSAPDLLAEEQDRQQAASQEKAQEKEKKGFFSRFFGL